jgi:hypothetical protein
LWLRTKVMPRWMALLTYPLALLLLFVFTESFWVVLVFPAWVFLVAVHILIVSFRRRPDVQETVTQAASDEASD